MFGLFLWGSRWGVEVRSFSFERRGWLCGLYLVVFVVGGSDLPIELLEVEVEVIDVVACEVVLGGLGRVGDVAVF